MPRASKQSLPLTKYGICGRGTPGDLSIEKCILRRQPEPVNRCRFHDDFRSICFTAIQVNECSPERLEADSFELNQIAEPIIEPIQFDLRAITPEALLNSEIETARSLGPKIWIA